jgi:hypothetical protein
VAVRNEQLLVVVGGQQRYDVAKVGRVVVPLYPICISHACSACGEEGLQVHAIETMCGCIVERLCLTTTDDVGADPIGRGGHHDVRVGAHVLQ